MNYTQGEWKAKADSGVTGPTTAALPSPVCGGEDWPYRVITVGMDTIAIVPAQPDSHEVGYVGEPIKGSAEANANLIAAAPAMYGALREAHDFLDRQNGKYGNETELCLYCHSKETDGFGIKHEMWCPIQKARNALAKAEGKQ